MKYQTQTENFIEEITCSSEQASYNPLVVVEEHTHVYTTGMEERVEEFWCREQA